MVHVFLDVLEALASLVFLFQIISMQSPNWLTKMSGLVMLARDQVHSFQHLWWGQEKKTSGEVWLATAPVVLFLT